MTVVGSTPSSARNVTSLHRRVERAFDLDDHVVEQTLHLDQGARRIGRLAPELGPRLVDQRREAVEIADIDHEPHAILQARALGLGDGADVEEGWRICAGGSVTMRLVAGSMPGMPATKTKSPARAPRLQVPSAFMLPGGARVLTPSGDYAKAQLDAITIAIKQTTANRCNMSAPLGMKQRSRPRDRRARAGSGYSPRRPKQAR